MREHLQKLAREEDLILLGVVSLECEKDYSRYLHWLEQGRQAGMAYLEKNLAIRKDPQQLLAEAKVAIVIALPYSLGDRWPASAGESLPRVAQYARFKDYHRLLKKKGESLALKFLSVMKDPHRFRVLVDSAPLLERAFAVKTSAGFIGKNTCYIHPKLGSFLLLGEILTSFPISIDEKAPIEPTRREEDGGCGTCTQCQIHCPTGALARDYSIDSNRCLAYWTIEHRGPIPEAFWPWLGTYYFGCDICQLVCPYNQPGMIGNAGKLPNGLEERKFPPLFDVATMNESAYEKYFGGTPLTRAKRNGLRRNALIAMAVTSDPKLPLAMKIADTDCAFPIAETLLQIRKQLQ